MKPKITSLKDVKCVELKADGRKLFVAISNYENLYDPQGFSFESDIEIVAGLPMHDTRYNVGELKEAIFEELIGKQQAQW